MEKSIFVKMAKIANLKKNGDNGKLRKLNPTTFVKWYEQHLIIRH